MFLRILWLDRMATAFMLSTMTISTKPAAAVDFENGSGRGPVEDLDRHHDGGDHQPVEQAGTDAQADFDEELQAAPGSDEGQRTDGDDRGRFADGAGQAVSTPVQDAGHGVGMMW